MSKLIEKILTDSKSRSSEELEKAAFAASAGDPWGGVN
jgi:hypothetical protein